MRRKHVKIFLVWLVSLNWPPILIWIPFLNLVAFLPYLLWINIPALWLGLAKLMGKPYYDIQEFGAMPQTLLSWILIASFWVLVAIGLTVVTAFLTRLLYGKRVYTDGISGNGQKDNKT